MGTTCVQDKAFLESIIESTVLEKAIEWIRKNMDPDDVFRVDQLETWAEQNNYERE